MNWAESKVRGVLLTTVQLVSYFVILSSLLMGWWDTAAIGALTLFAVTEARMDRRLAEIDRRAREHALIAAAKYLRWSASSETTPGGQLTPRGAAFWDAGCAIDPRDHDGLRVRSSL